MSFAQERGEHVRGFKIEIVVRAVQIRRHRRDEIRTVFARKRLAKLDASDLGNCISFVRWLQRPAEQSAFRDGLRRKLRVNAGASEKKQFAHAVLVCRADDVVLNPQVLQEELDGIIVVRLDPANLRRCDNDDIRLFLGKKFRHRRFICEIQLRTIARHQIAKCFRSNAAHERAAHHSPMARDENLIGSVHDVY